MVGIQNSHAHFSDKILSSSFKLVLRPILLPVRPDFKGPGAQIRIVPPLLDPWTLQVHLGDHLDPKQQLAQTEYRTYGKH